jgi:hypothetical protein
MTEPKIKTKANTLTTTTDAEKPQLPVEVFHEMERRDENQILAEMRGELIEDLVYSIDIQGRRVTNLSYAGVKEATRRRGNLEILEVRTEETDEEIRALVRVRDHNNRIDVLGASSAEKKKPFSYTLAVNKAERNAFAKLIPAKWYAVLIDEYLARRKGKPAPTKPEEAAPPRPPEEWQLKVPITKDPIAINSVKQYPLIDGTTAIGMLSALEDGSQVSIVPERPIKADDPAIANFLIPRILDQIAAKHPDFQYQLVKSGDGLLTAIVVRGKLEEHQIRELASAAKWSFQRVLEKEKQPVQQVDR